MTVEVTVEKNNKTSKGESSKIKLNSHGVSSNDKAI
jgi:hypothetical protein